MRKMNVLLLGSGGREHALARSFSLSPRLDKLYLAPGNAGSHSLGEPLECTPTDFEGLAKVVERNNIDFICVGPEQPLVNGVYDFFAERNIPVFGPSQAAAQLEGSKGFAKAFMSRHNIPTASYMEVTADNIEEGMRHLEHAKGPYVLKADGLAAGKGVLILDSLAEAKTSLGKMILEQQFGQSSARVVIEEFLTGIEFSVFVLTDGKDYKILPTAKDYKRVGEGDTGLNTGGMGAVSPPPFLSEEIMAQVERVVIQPTINGLHKEGLIYHGVVYIGLILSKEGNFHVIEYNCRFGDPETQVVLPRITSDVLDACWSAATGSLKNYHLAIDTQCASTVVVASKGYPEAYAKGLPMTLPVACRDALIYHAGTKRNGDALVTNGGRVVSVTALGNNLKASLIRAKEVAGQVQFDGAFYRADIGYEFV
tara:strand:- start:511 stop:1785 length:1275 start_codon:yes stop_codon:yes gene_type:complete